MKMLHYPKQVSPRLQQCNVESWTGFDSVIISSGAEQPRAVYPGATSSEVKVERGTAIE